MPESARLRLQLCCRKFAYPLLWNADFRISLEQTPVNGSKAEGCKTKTKPANVGADQSAGLTRGQSV